eukprot:gene135-211_t
MGWSGDTLLEMSDGKAIRAHNLKRGHYLRSDIGTPVCVECVVLTKLENFGANGRHICSLNFAECVRADVDLDQYALSEKPSARGHSWNPVYVPGKFLQRSMNWRYIRDVAQKEGSVIEDEYTYDIVLTDENRHRLISIYGGIFIPGLGHNLTDSLIAHPYFGTISVINDLKLDPDYAKCGRVLISERNYIRSLDAMQTVQQIDLNAAKKREDCIIA